MRHAESVSAEGGRPMKESKSAVRLLYTAAIFIASAVSSAPFLRRFLRHMTRQPNRLRKYWSTALRLIGLEQMPWEETFFHGSFMVPGLPWLLHSVPHSVPWCLDCLWAWCQGILGDWRINPYSALWRSFRDFPGQAS